MSFEADEEILQDFLIEAGEILEAMSEQLVALENEPENMDLLNSIFRGFHTVKGGAGFLSLDPLVEICHITENIFDILRNGERDADAELMDNILQALDIVNEMFDSVRNGELPEPASKEFLEKLGTYAVAKPATEASAPTPIESNKTQESTDSDQITDDEFEQLLDEINAGEATVESAPSDPVLASSNDDITDEEFERLLDELHGNGSVSSPDTDTQKSKANKQSKAANPEYAVNQPDSEKSAPTSDDITDAEFEALLDELHGKGSSVSNSNSSKSTESTAQTKPVVASTPSQKTSSAKPPSSSSSDDGMIDDDEFEALLDELHGSGASPSNAQATHSNTAKNTAKETNKVSPPKSSIKAPAAKASVINTSAKPAAAVKPAASFAVADKPGLAKKTANPVVEATVRVDTKRLDEIMNMVGELVLARNRLKTLGQSTQNAELTKAIATLDLVTADLQGAVMKTRMQPIKKVFGRFPRVVRDLARSLKKEISLEMIGEETDLDKNLVEALADPLVHLVRNSVDHGIESPEDRVAAGKVKSGKIILSAAQEGDHIMLAIQDDGKGMDANVLRNIAIDKGIMDRDHAERLSDNECYNLIFMAGFSTKKEISDISGRGVGMDVVKTKITQLNGSLSIDSTIGKGTKISIKVPLTLAIMPTLMVKVKDQTFALPLNSVNEIFNLDLTKTNIVDGQLVIVVREKALPLFFLNEWLTHSASKGERLRQGHVVLIQVGTQRVGFVVDSLIGQEEVVIKPLGKSLQGTPGMAGATITSDGGIALILDIPTLLKHYAK